MIDRQGTDQEEMLVPYLPGACTSPLEPPIVEALRSVYDPEIPVSIFDLGLIYNLTIDQQGNVVVLMTLTAPTCPVAEELPRWVQGAVAAVEGVESVEIELTWEPFWRPEYMTVEARLQLNLLPTSGELSHLFDDG